MSTKTQPETTAPEARQETVAELVAEYNGRPGWVVVNWDRYKKSHTGVARIGASSRFVLSKEDEGKKGDRGMAPFTVFYPPPNNPGEEYTAVGYEVVPLGPVTLASGWRKDEVCGKVSEGNKVWIEVAGPVAVHLDPAGTKE